MITTITGTKHHDLNKISDCLVPKNLVFVTHDEKWDKPAENGCDGLAWKCTTKGVDIGYLPLVRTLRKYLKDAHSNEARQRIIDRGRATKQIRNQLRIDYENNGTDQFKAIVAGLLYFKKGKWLEFDEFSMLSPEEQAGWTLEQVAINFPDVLDF